MRMCRVLLDASARTHQRAHLTLTQEELANILGVQRSTIAVAYSALQHNGLIHSRRGSIDIVDFAGLEAAACSCRETIAFAQDRKSVVSGKSVSVRVDLGGRLFIKKKK